jgi:hypothetical protein
MSPETKLATLAFLSFPKRGVFVLNISTTDGAYQRIQISKYQLGNIIADGTGSLLRRSLNDVSRGTNDAF